MNANRPTEIARAYVSTTPAGRCPCCRKAPAPCAWCQQRARLCTHCGPSVACVQGAFCRPALTLADAVPSFNPDCKRCVDSENDRSERVANGATVEAVESPCHKCGHIKSMVRQ